MEFREIASGLRFPEGPVAMDDGSIVSGRDRRRAASRASTRTARTQTIAKPGGGPERGLCHRSPYGALYVCNNGANFNSM